MADVTNINELPLGSLSEQVNQQVIQYDMMYGKMKDPDAALERLTQERNSLLQSTTPQVQQQQIDFTQPLPNNNANTNANNLTQISPELMQSFINSLQEARLKGATQLPTRDVPMDSTAIVQDQQAMTHYIPSPPNDKQGDYIGNDKTNQDIINAQQQHLIQINRANAIYNEFHLPLILGLLFLLFQLPVFKWYLLKIFPAFFKSDGNFKLYGYMFMSVLFVICFMSMQLVLDKCSHFSF